MNKNYIKQNIASSNRDRVREFVVEKSSTFNINSESPNDLIHIYYQNVRLLRSKIKDPFRDSSACNFDLIIITKTWLIRSIFDNELFDNSFMVFRNVRSACNSQHDLGGGVHIATRCDSFQRCERVFVSGTEHLEILIVNMRNLIQSLYI